MSAAKAGALTGLRLLTRDEIAAAPDLEQEVVPVPEWGEDAAVLVQGMDVNRRLAYVEYISVFERNPLTGAGEYTGKPFTPADAALAALCIVDERDEPMFTLNDVEVLGHKNPDVISRIAEVARRLSHWGKYDTTRENGNGANPKALNGSSPDASQGTLA